MYLSIIGYEDISLVDGPRDGGRDVNCSRSDLRIQLSVRKDWKIKINEEATKTQKAGFKHFVYVTNRAINQGDEQDFIQEKYCCKGNVDVYIHDLNKIVTALSRPGVIRRSCERLGLLVPPKIEATADEIAMSTMLLFSPEARKTREEIISANIRAHLFKLPGDNENDIILAITNKIPGENVAQATKTIISRLQSSGKIKGPSTSLSLSVSENDTMMAAEMEFLTAAEVDIKMLSHETSLSYDHSKELLYLALDLLVRNRDLNGPGATEEALRSFMAKHNLNKIRDKVYGVLSQAASAKFKQYGETIDMILSTNTFDIYRSLGGQTQIKVVLDASVAMPLLFTLEFGAVKSRYGVAARAFIDSCKAHGFDMVVPQCYLNEMASHGNRALEKVDTFNAFTEELHQTLRYSRNAYISHYMEIKETFISEGKELSLIKFLNHFGVTKGRPLYRIENFLRSMLEKHNIGCIPGDKVRPEVFDSIFKEKPNAQRIIVEHDAIVCTTLMNDDKNGFVFSTWDNVLIKVVEGISRVLVDTPPRVIDFLSMAQRMDTENDCNYELLSSLLYMDEAVARKLAEKIDKINTVERAFELNDLIEKSKQRFGPSWVLKPDDIASLGHEESPSISLEMETF
jgi:hypothetical protein